MTRNADKPRYLSPSEAAARLMVSPVTLRHWALAGKLTFVTTPGGHRRFAEKEIERLAVQKQHLAAGPSKNIELIPNDDNHRILVVDDDQQMSRVLVKLLQGLPSEIETEIANDGFDAGQKILSFRPHTVLLSITMPGLKGFEVCQKIKESPVTRDIRVVVMSGNGPSMNIQKAMDAGADGCLTKPLDEAQLFKAILSGGESQVAV